MKRKRADRELRLLRRAVRKLQEKMRAAYHAISELDDRTRAKDDIIGFRVED